MSSGIIKKKKNEKKYVDIPGDWFIVTNKKIHKEQETDVNSTDRLNSGRKEESMYVCMFECMYVHKRYETYDCGAKSWHGGKSLHHDKNNTKRYT